MVYDKWSDDEFLDILQQHADELADRTVAKLIEENGIQKVDSIFRLMTSSDDQIPPNAPAVFHEFVTLTRDLPANIDQERLVRFDTLLPYGPVACTVMLASSLPQGYSAPRLSQILAISDDLETHPYKRLMGVLQLLVNLGNRDSFVPGGRAIVTAQKMRLLHAGVRFMVSKHKTEYRQRFGVPVNLEDELATLMGFSLLVIDGLRKLKCRMTDEAAEGRYYRWRVFAQLMGIHPPGRPDDDSWIPANLDEASRFYASYIRRHFTGPEENPEGVKLSQRNLELMERLVGLVPIPLRWLGLRFVPRIAMTELLTPEQMARTGISPIVGHSVLKAVLTVVAHLFYGLWVHMPPNLVQMASYLMHKTMIEIGRGGDVTFEIPTSLNALRGEGFV